MVPRLAVLLVAALAILPLGNATNGPLAVHYVLASGTPGPGSFGLYCYHIPSFPLGGGTVTAGPLGFEKKLPDVDTPETYVGGACLHVGTGTHTLRVVDDLGGSPAFWYEMTLPGPGGRYLAFCGGGQAQGEIVLTSDVCTHLEVTPLAGSAAGTIFVS